MRKSELLSKINDIIIEDNKQKAIDILCELLSDKQNRSENIDLIYILIDAFQLYGYTYSLNREKFKNSFNMENFEYRLETYKGKKIEYYNSGQLSLIDKIEEENKTIISAPTSFGKTSLVIEYILAHLDKINNIIFILPTKSLIEELYIKYLQINRDLLEKYSVTVNILKNKYRTIRLLTPEKFLSYYEYNKLENIDLLVMDEAYKIEDEQTNNRGKTVINKRAYKFRKVMEIISNSNIKTIILSPYTYEKDISMQEYMNKYNVLPLNRTLNYVKHNYIDLSTIQEYKKFFNIGEQILKKEYNNIPDKAFQILMKIKDSSNVIYINITTDAIRIVNKLEINNCNFLTNTNDRYEKFINHLIENYNVEEADEWYVITALKLGVGIYVSSMPRYVKKEIINLFEEGIIKCLIVSTAFIEGVNSCAENIILTSGYTGKNIELNQMSLLNISGRAGRFGKRYIGNVFFINNKIYENVIMVKDKGVSLSNPNYKKNFTDTRRDDYEIEMIDEKYLNEKEKERKIELEQKIEENNINIREMNNISISAPNEWKLLLYKFFLENTDYENFRKYINQVLGDEEDKLIEGMTNIFQILRNCGIEFESNYTDVNAFNKKGEFIWGKLYTAHVSGSIKNVLNNKKRYIMSQYNLHKLNNTLEYEFKDMWMSKYFDKNWIFNDNKLYEETFKFISNIIEYKIPYYLSLFINVFRFFIEKNNVPINDNEDIDLSEAIAKIETLGIDEELIEFYDFGFSKDIIDKMKKFEQNIFELDIDKLEEFDEYEKLMLKDYKELIIN